MIRYLRIIHRENADVLQSAHIDDPSDATAYAVGAMFQKGDLLQYESGRYTVVRRLFRMNLTEPTLEIYVTKIPQGNVW